MNTRLLLPIQILFSVVGIPLMLVSGSARNSMAQSTPYSASQGSSVGTLPSNFPTFNRTADSLSPKQDAKGSIFLSNFSFAGAPVSGYFLMILNDSASPIFYREMPAPCLDFKMQPNGLLTYMDESTYKFYAMDSNYAIVDSFYCGNNVRTDVHDLELLPNGHALMLGIDTVVTDMSKIWAGGDSNATVISNHIQEIDQQKNVVFDWQGAQHFNILDARGVDFTTSQVDFEHSNSVQMDTDGNIILSSRHLDEVSKIDRTTGNFIWRFGGAHNQFRIIGDTLPFSHQHNVRRIANGNLTLFDNGNLNSPQVSRAMEYTLDVKNMTATTAWEYIPADGIYSLAMGDVERLPNGNTFIGWGSSSLEAAREVTPNDSVVYQLSFGDNNVSYRAYRQPWNPPTSSKASVPAATMLAFSQVQNYPNPFVGSTTLFFTLDTQAPIVLKIQDELGRTVSTVAQGLYGAGKHAMNFNAGALPTGIYYAVLQTPSWTKSTRMVLSK